MDAPELELIKFYQSKFTLNQERLLSRGGSVLVPTVDDSGAYRGESAEVVKQYGSAKARVGNEDRNGDTPNFTVARDQAWVFPTLADWGTTFDKIDEMKQLVDPTSPVNEAAQEGMSDSMDLDIILPAYFGDRKTGKGAATTKSFPASANDIGIQVGGAGVDTGMNVAKLIEARRLARKKRWKIPRSLNNGPSWPLYCGLTSQQESELMSDQKYIDRDYGEPVLDGDGRLKKFYGFEFVIMEEWPWAANVRSLPVWTKKSIHFGRWNSLSVNLAPNPQKKFIPTLYMWQMFGATRTQEDLVLRIQCKDTTGP